MSKAKFHIAFFAASFVLTFSIVAIILSFWFEKESTSKIMLKQGFDFRLLRSNNDTLSEPKIGAKINLTDLETSRKEKLSDFPNKKLLLFAVVDPRCAACNFSKDMMRDIHETASELDIEYFPVVFVKTPSNFDTQRYAETLGFETCVLWSSVSTVPKSLSEMVTPSHFLTNKDGIILQIWFGSDKDAEVRKRMSQQISSDLLLVNEVVRATEISDKRN